MTSHQNTSIGKVADAIQEALANAEEAYWYRRTMDKSGYEVLFTPPHLYGCAGEGRIVANRKHPEAAEKYVNRQRAIFVAQAAIEAVKKVQS